MNKIKLIPGCKPQVVTKYVYNNLPRFAYSNGKKIKIGDSIRWVLLKKKKELNLILIKV